jgi:hypothetical protein
LGEADRHKEMEAYMHDSDLRNRLDRTDSPSYALAWLPIGAAILAGDIL